MSRSRYLYAGNGLVNSLINRLPIELHIPGYQYCGPGTKLQQRLQRGDPGINKLDKACKEHDIAYSQNKDNLSARHDADKVLENKAWSRVLATDSSLPEKAAAWSVANTMKVKRKLGMGMKMGVINKIKKRTCKKPTLNTVKKVAKLAINSKGKSLKHMDDLTAQGIIKTALKAAKREVKNHKPSVHTISKDRIIPLPKTGGILPLIPIFAGLSALGALTGGAAGVAKTIISAKNAKKELEENKRHNRTMQAIAIGKGLQVAPTSNGYGLYLTPYPKNH